MQISLTKKLADAIGAKPMSADDTIAPLFCWTASWINTFVNRKEDMVVMVNHATRFTVTIYGIRRTNFKNIATKMQNAIRNTLIAMNLSAEVIDGYLAQAGEIQFASNQNRQATAWVNRQGLEAALFVGDVVNDSAGRVKYDDTLGAIISDRLVTYGNGGEDYFIPREKMIAMLTELAANASCLQDKKEAPL